MITLTTSVHSRYGYLLGVWSRKSPPYLGLLQVRYESGCIIGSDWRVPGWGNSQLIQTRVFSVELDDVTNDVTKGVVMRCLLGVEGRGGHACKITTYNKEYSRSCLISCNYPSMHSSNECYQWWISDIQGFNLQRKMLKWDIMSRYNLSFTYDHLPGANIQHWGERVLPSGYFMTCYGTSEYDLVKLGYEGNHALVDRLTNTATATTRTIKSSLVTAMRFDTTGAHGGITLTDITIEMYVGVRIRERLPVKRFVLPGNCRCLLPELLPATYQVAFKGTCYHCSGSRATRGLFIVFNSQIFGFFTAWKLLLFKRIPGLL